MRQTKTIGLIGGITWESTLEYYRTINRAMQARLGGLHSARLVMTSFDFHDVRQLSVDGREDLVLERFVEAARTLQAAGAGLLVLCANTAHRRADALVRRVPLPLVHIADATGAEVRRHGLSRVGLLGTRPTMEEAFLRSRLEQQSGLTVDVPSAGLRQALDEAIFGEMARGIFSDAARRLVEDAIAEVRAAGAEGVILGCTELPILMRGVAAPCPLFDTAELHALAAVDQSLAD